MKFSPFIDRIEMLQVQNHFSFILHSLMMRPYDPREWEENFVKKKQFTRNIDKMRNGIRNEKNRVRKEKNGIRNEKNGVRDRKIGEQTPLPVPNGSVLSSGDCSSTRAPVTLVAGISHTGRGHLHTAYKFIPVVEESEESIAHDLRIDRLLQRD